MFKLFGKKNNTKIKKGKFSREKTFVLNENSPFSVQEAYKTLRTNLIFSLPGKGCKKILLTSTTMNEGKSTTAINLSKVLSENGYRVLLLDCDLRLSCAARTLDLAESPGLSDVLVNISDVKKAIQPFTENFHVVTAGTTPPNPSELLGSQAMETFLASVENSYDYIIMDAPPVGMVTDAVVLSRFVTGFIFVVKRGVAQKDALDSCLRSMNVSGAKNLGFVFTNADLENSKYGSGYYGGYYK